MSDTGLQAHGEASAAPRDEQAVWAHRLHRYLTDPTFTGREDFPAGTPAAILQLADPPYYTPCPNPFLQEIVQGWQAQRPPTAVAPVGPCPELPVSTKTDKSYTLHTYHSKVPASTLAHLIDHYCAPGDVVLDCFCGSGVTGVACAKVSARGKPVHAVLLDLSPAATFITYNYLFGAPPEQLQAEGAQLLAAVAPFYDSLYRDAYGDFSYTIYADQFRCPHCATAVTFWDAMVDVAAMRLKPTLRCTQCGEIIPKAGQARVWRTHDDELIGKPVTQAEQVPVARKYGRRLRILTAAERQQAVREQPRLPLFGAPLIPWPDGANLSQPKRSHGISHLHHLFTPRNLAALTQLWHAAGHYPSHRQLRFAMTAFMLKTGSRLHNIGFKHGGLNLAGQLPNTYYLPNLSAERHIGQLFADKLRGLAAFYATAPQRPSAVISTSSATRLDLPDNSIDYCLTDPPFGGFVHYGDLNFVWEAWLGVMANRTAEAIIYAPEGKDYAAYEALLTAAFREIYRVLKPGKWLTLIFHNSQNGVWNIMQRALLQAGFVVADVRAAMRGQGSYKQMTSTVAVHSDLLVSAYKPAEQATPSQLTVGSLAAVWEWVQHHLGQLPLPDDHLAVLAERQPHMLFDRMVAFHVQHGLAVPVSAAAFYRGLDDYFCEHNDMYFLPAQLPVIAERSSHRDGCV